MIFQFLLQFKSEICLGIQLMASQLIYFVLLINSEMKLFVTKFFYVTLIYFSEDSVFVKIILSFTRFDDSLLQ